MIQVCLGASQGVRIQWHAAKDEQLLTAYADETPLHAYKGTSFLFCGVGKGDVTRRCPKKVCRQAQESPCGDGEPFVSGVCN